MNMFNWSPGPGQRVTSPYLYIFFVVTVPVTAIVFAVWIWWFKISQKLYQKRHEEGLQDVEKKLRLAIRSATNTW